MADNVRTERWSRVREGPTLAFLDRAPYENVFLSHLATADASGSMLRNVHVAVDDADRIRGVAYFGRQIVLAADDAAIPAFARIGAARGGERAIVGPRAQIARYWSLVAAVHAPPRRVRERQLLMALEPGDLRGEDPRVRVRLARPDERDAVAVNSAEMIRDELEYDPRREDGGFAGGIALMIERRLWWVGEVEGELCFLCNVGPWSARTAQLQGIWTPPAMRGRGLATASLAGICRRLFESVPTLSLYVNDFNGAAVRLYGRTGFRTVGELQTLLF